ncbi:MAG TPA: TonB-dependent receptor [Bryobacteraceae bacterium]|nr:TonB-dependent receptor [Bryobacteraceae bacterium]
MQKSFTRWRAPLGCAIALVFSLPLAAQIGGGTIQGTVTDPSGAVIPGATVVAANVATGVKTTRETTAAGVYSITPLTPGQYTVTVTAPGFQTVVQQQIIVDALGTVGLNLTLKLGQQAQQVTVTTEPAQLNTADARMGETMRNDEYSALPLAMGNGAPRNPLSFQFLLPGVTNTSRWGNTLGAQDFANDLYVEGIAITNSVQEGEGRNLSLGISVEAVDQFQAETAGTAVQFNGQGVQNYTIKSGTNSFHGSVYEYFRNTHLDARGFFSSVRAAEHQNEYGFTFGGPIVRNKAFFFGSYDGYKYRAGSQASFYSIPTETERKGDFSAVPTTIYDPATTDCSSGPCTRLPFAGNVIPSNRISPISQYFQQFLPATVNGAIQNNYLGSVPTGLNNYNTTDKVDVNLTENNRFTAMYSRGHRGQSTAYRGGTLPLPYAVTRLVDEIPTTASTKYTAVLRPNLLNQLSFGFARIWVPITSATAEGLYPQKAGLKGLPPGDADASFPELSFSGPNSPTGWRGTDARPFTEAMNTFTLQDNVQWVHGKHSITAGFQMQRLQDNYIARVSGSLFNANFSNNQTLGFDSKGNRLTTTGNSYASYLLGAVNSSSVIEDSVVGTGARFTSYAWWLNDDYKVAPRLTLNLGLRYDIMLPYKEVLDRESFFNPNMPNPAADGFPGALMFYGDGPDSCQCSSNIKTYYGAWGPRVGLAYSINDKTVFRASYGIMYSRSGAVGGRGGARDGTGTLGYSASGPFGSDPDGHSPVFDWDDGIPAFQHAPFFDSTLNTGFTTTNPKAGGMTYGDPFIGGRPPRYQNWSIGFQRAITNETTISANYVGSNGHFLRGGGRGLWSGQILPKYLTLGSLLTQKATPANVALAQKQFPEIGLPFPSFNGTISQMLRPFPQYSGVSDIWGDVADSHYNSFQLLITQRHWKGLTMHFNYTLSKSIDNTSGSRSAYNWSTETAVTPEDATHVINMTVVYDIPFGEHSASRLFRNVVHGWEISAITQFNTGRPLGTASASCNLPNAGGCYADYNPSFSGPVQIADYGSGNLLGSNTAVYLDKTAFQNPAPYTYGNTPRTLAYALRGPSSFTQDLSLRREFQIHENVKFQLQADATNWLNHVVFRSPSLNTTSSSFGKITGQANGPRVVQFAARVTF